MLRHKDWILRSAWDTQWDSVLLKWQRANIVCRGKGGEGKKVKNGIRICYVHASAPHKECKHFVLQKCTTKWFEKNQILNNYVQYDLTYTRLPNMRNKIYWISSPNKILAKI